MINKAAQQGKREQGETFIFYVGLVMVIGGAALVSFPVAIILVGLFCMMAAVLSAFENK